MRSLRAAAAAAVCGLIVIGSTAPGAEQQPAPAEPLLRSPSPLRISVELVQLDATVTDENGRHVTNLEAADFEVLQDNRPQTISAFQYVPAGAAPRLHGSSAPAAAAVTLPSAPPTRDAVRRTMAIVVDDLNLSFESIARVRAALRRFIDEQMRPGDLVAILRTAAGMGALQQFTTDRRALHAAADRVRWTMMGRISSFGASELDERLEPLEKEIFAAGTLGAIQYVMRGIEELPGRKAILLLSDGFRMTDADMKYGRILDMMRSVADAASRAGVVIYGIDLRGLVSTAPTASEGSAAPTPGMLAQKRAELAETKDSLELLSHETGGFLVADTNDISGGVGPHPRRSAGLLPARLRPAGLDVLPIESAISPNHRPRETAGTAGQVAARVHWPPDPDCRREHTGEPHDCRGDVAVRRRRDHNAAQLLLRPLRGRRPGGAIGDARGRARPGVHRSTGRHAARSARSDGDDVRRQRPGRRSAQPPLHGAPDGRASRAGAPDRLRLQPAHAGEAARALSAARRAARRWRGSHRLGQPVHRRAGSRQAAADALEPLHPGSRRRRHYRRCCGSHRSRRNGRRTQVSAQRADRLRLLRLQRRPRLVRQAARGVGDCGCFATASRFSGADRSRRTHRRIPASFPSVAHCSSVRPSRPAAISWSSRSPTAGQRPRGARRGPSISR